MEFIIFIDIKMIIIHLTKIRMRKRLSKNLKKDFHFYLFQSISFLVENIFQQKEPMPLEYTGFKIGNDFMKTINHHRSRFSLCVLGFYFAHCSFFCSFQYSSVSIISIQEFSSKCNFVVAFLKKNYLFPGKDIFIRFYHHCQYFSSNKFYYRIVSCLLAIPILF